MRKYTIFLWLSICAIAARGQDIGWPRQVKKNGDVLVYYQPQLDTWKDYKELKAGMAFSLTPKGGKPLMGVADLEAATDVDKEKRTVYFSDVKVTDTRFPSLGQDSVKLMGALFRQLAPTPGEPISLDRLMADMPDKIKASTVAVKNEVPEIFYSATPAVLLIVEGEQVLAPIDKTGLHYIVNTNWDVFVEKKGKASHYYLLVNNSWFTADDVKGNWTPTRTLPKEMSKLPAGQQFDDVKRFVPPPASSGTVPHIYYGSVPAELILLKGAPVYTRISGTSLLYVTNTDNDLFADVNTGQYYVLLSGRWFRSKSFSGPWSYAGNDLPESFARIPSSSAKAHVLASVPGTVEASDAVMLAQIPTTTLITKAEAEAKVQVHYDGTPAFSPIETTSLEYATNTQEKIIKDGDLYYLCFQGVWFMSTKPEGPWKTADAVPDEIYTIPPSSPVYNVVYVKQTNATATTVESSCTAGYFGMFVVGMAVGAAIVYGTGFYHPPFIFWGPAALFPVYRPWPATYGAGAVYNPWTGGWATGRAAYGPYGAAHSSAWYNPATGRYGRSASVQGRYGGRTAASSYNPWTGGYGATVQGHNAYAQWGHSVATRGNRGIETGHITTARGSVTGYRTASGRSGVITHGARGTVVHGSNTTFAGRDGNVYRKNNSGSWSQYHQGGWHQAPPAAHGTIQQLNRSSESRIRGQAQTNRFQHSQPAARHAAPARHSMPSGRSVRGRRR